MADLFYLNQILHPTLNLINDHIHLFFYQVSLICAGKRFSTIVKDSEKFYICIRKGML